MINLCMITHDQFEKKDPRADLIRFKSLGKALSVSCAEVVVIGTNDRMRYEERRSSEGNLCKVPLFSKNHFVQLVGFYLVFLPVLFRAKRWGPFHIIFVNSVFTVPGALLLKWVLGGSLIQFDLMGILSLERFPKNPKHGWNAFAKKALVVLENFLWSRVDFITTINEQHRRLLEERIRRPVHVVRDGVFEETYKHLPARSQDRSGASRTVLIFVGQINYFRLDPLFKILPALTAELPTLHVKVLGTGPQLKRYQEMAASAGLQERVTFLGHVPHEEIFEHIVQADIAYSDDWSIHGFPMKLFDYMAMGTAIVVQETEGVRELMVDGVNALLYRDSTELKEKVLALARDEELRRRLGENARRMMEQHTWEKRCDELESLYSRLLAQ